MEKEKVIALGTIATFVIFTLIACFKGSGALNIFTIASYTMTSVTMILILWAFIKNEEKVLSMPQVKLLAVVAACAILLGILEQSILL